MKTSITSSSRPRRASGSRPRSRACGWESASSTPTSRSWTPSGSSSASATTRRSPGAMASRRSSRPRMASTSFRCARAPTPATAAVFTGCTWGTFPRATAVMPAGGKPGETLSVRWIGDPAGETTSTIKLPPTFEREFGIQRQDDKGFSPYPNAFRLSTLGNVIEKEPNDDQAHATPFEAPMALNGVIEKPGDVDQFVFKATKGQVFDIHCYARRIRSPLDPVMYLGKKGAGAMLGADDSVGPDSYFRFQAPEDGRVRRLAGRPAGQGRAGLCLPDRGHAGRARAHDDDQRRTDPAGNRGDVGRRAQGEPAGDLDLRQSGRLRRRSECGRRQAAGGRERGGADDRRQPGDRAGALFGQGRCTAGRGAGGGHRQAGRPQAQCPVAIQPDVRAGAGPEQRQCLVADRRSPGGGGHRGMPVHDRDRRAQGAAGAERLDGAEGPRDPQAGVQGGDLGLSAVEPAGRRLGRRNRDSRRARTRRSFR